MKLPISAKGFTLQELLITMTIIGILSVIGFSSFHTIQLKGTDQRRKEDINSIAQALNLYYRTNKSYPCTTGWQYSTGGANWLSNTDTANCPTLPTNLTPDYLDKLPLDPMNNAASPWLPGNYSYAYFDSGPQGSCAEGTYYFLVAQLQTDNDSDSFGAKHNNVCGQAAAVTFASGGPSANDYVVIGEP